PPTPEQEHLQLLVRTRAVLREELQGHLNRLHAAAGGEQEALLHPLLQPLVAVLEQQIRQIAQQIAQLSGERSLVGEQLRCLSSIPGVGVLTAATLLAEVPFARL